jgi:hypothetical protein
MEATSTHLNSTTWGVVFYHNPYANISKKSQNVWLCTKNDAHVAKFYNPKIVQILVKKMNNLKS